jgi:hypothetical protein
MNYIYIDTKTGDFGEMHSRKDIETATGGVLTQNQLETLFSRETKKRPKKRTFVNDRFIVLPVRENNEVYNDPELVGSIITLLR